MELTSVCTSISFLRIMVCSHLGCHLIVGMQLLGWLVRKTLKISICFSGIGEPLDEVKSQLHPRKLFNMCITMQGAVSCLHMVHCFHMAGFPNGLICALTGKGSEIGDLLTMHPGINCIR